MRVVLVFVLAFALVVVVGDDPSSCRRCHCCCSLFAVGSRWSCGVCCWSSVAG